MRRLMLVSIAALTLAAMLATPSAGVLPAEISQVVERSVATAAVDATHPRLLFSADDVAAMRARVAAPGSVPAGAFARLMEKVEGYLVKVQPEVIRADLGTDDGQIAGQNTNGLEKPYTLQKEMPTYLIELGMAYQISGDVRFGRRAVDLLLALGDTQWPYWCCQDLGIGDLLGGVGLAYDWTWELMTPAEREQIVASMWTPEMEEKLFCRALFCPVNAYAANDPTSNWMAVTSGGAGLTLLAIAGEAGIPVERAAMFDTYLNKALERTQNYLDEAFSTTGAGHEGLLYAGYGLSNAVPFTLAARRAGFGDMFEGTGLRNVARWAAFEQLPGEGENFIPLNDSQRAVGGIEFWAMQFGIDPDNGVAQWIWQRTAGPQGGNYFAEPHVPDIVREDKCKDKTELIVTVACDLFNSAGMAWTIMFYRTPEETPEVDPATVGPRSIHHVERGLVDARTGFAGGLGEVVSTFEAHRNGHAHFQYDVGNYTIYGYGGRWAIDPGYMCNACGQTNEAGYPTQHNVVVIDGSRDTQHYSSREWLGTTIDSFIDAPNVTLTHADLRYAYSFHAEYAGRDHLFSRVPGRPVIVGIADSLQRDRDVPAPLDHAYTWQMLSNKDNIVQLDGAAFTITSPELATMVGQTAAGGDAGADPTTQLRFEVLTNSSSDIGSAMPTVSTTTPRQPTFDHLAVMALTPPGVTPATTEILRVDGGNAVEVTWEGVSDVVVSRLADATEVTGSVATDAAMAKFTRNAGETVLRGGTRLSADGRDYVVVDGSPATVAVSGDTAQAQGNPGNRYRVFAPQDVTTLVNGAVVSSCRDGDHVSFPCQSSVATVLTYTGQTVRQGSRIEAAAALKTAHGTPVAGALLHFRVNDDVVDVVTDANGRAATTLRIPGRQNQPVELVIGYDGTDTTLPSSLTTIISSM